MSNLIKREKLFFGPYIFPGLGYYDFDPEEIKEQVCISYGISMEIINEHTNKRESVEPRQTAIAIIKWRAEHLNMDISYRNIAEMFDKSRFNHATIIYSIAQVKNRYKTDSDYRELIDKLCNRFFITPQV